MPRIIAQDSLAASPWKNGGGITRQIACFPQDSGLDGFDWRLSMAMVAQDGGFSRFAGIDRRLYILEGAGLDLSIGTDTARRLTPGQHADFPGEAEVEGRLVDGAVTDFNIMVRRDRLRMEVTDTDIAAPAMLDLPRGMAALFVMAGEIMLPGPALRARRFDTVLIEAHEPRLLPVDGTARLLMIGFTPR